MLIFYFCYKIKKVVNTGVHTCTNFKIMFFKYIQILCISFQSGIKTVEDGVAYITCMLKLFFLSFTVCFLYRSVIKDGAMILEIADNES